MQMFSPGWLVRTSRWLPAAILLFFSSVIDELVSTVLLLDLASPTGFWPALFFATATAGGLLGGPVSGWLLQQIPALRRLLILVLAAEAVTIAPCLLLAVNPVRALALLAALLLGIWGATLWVVVMLYITELFTEAQLHRVNNVVTTIRNAGFVAGPALGGICYSFGSGYVYFCCMVLLLVAVGCTRLFVPPVVAAAAEPAAAAPAGRFISSVKELFGLPGLASRILPPMGVAFFGSLVNVGILVYILQVQGRTSAEYGLVGAAISIGLVAGPLALGFSGAKRLQVGIGAAGICTGIALLGLFQPWAFGLTLVAGLLLGIGNGGQNSFMSTLLMQAIPAQRRAVLMPAYVFSIYIFVFASFIAGLLLTAANVLPVMLAGGASTIGLGIISLMRRDLPKVNTAEC